MMGDERWAMSDEHITLESGFRFIILSLFRFRLAEPKVKEIELFVISKSMFVVVLF